MTTSPETGKRRPQSMWPIARTYLLAEHEGILDEILSAVNALDLEYVPRTLMRIEGLTETDVGLLKLAHPKLIFIEDGRGNCLLEDNGAFYEVEETLTSIGSHLSFVRLIIADFAIRNRQTFEMLEGRMAGRPDVFQTRLQLLKGQTCLR